MRLPKICNVTHLLLVIGKNGWGDWLSQNVQCHSLAVGHERICDETSLHRICNITCLLLVIGRKCDGLPFTICGMSLTVCWLMWRDSLSQNVQCYPQPVCHRKRHDETGFHTMCNVTHLLLVICRRTFGLAFTKFAMSLTPCWSEEKMWGDFTKCAMWHTVYLL